MEELTKKQKGFVKDYVETGNGTQAVLNNYDTKDEHTAAVIASENLTKPAIVKSIQEALPDELLAEKHLALLNKTEIKRTFDHSSGEWIDIETGQIDAQAVSKGLDLLPSSNSSAIAFIFSLGFSVMFMLIDFSGA